MSDQIARIENKLDRVADEFAKMIVVVDKMQSNLEEHMRRSAASEARIEIMETFVTKSMDNQQENFNALIQVNKDTQSSLNRQLKISLGVFAGLAALVTAFIKLIGG
jgi:hypothetical protein